MKTKKLVQCFRGLIGVFIFAMCSEETPSPAINPTIELQGKTVADQFDGRIDLNSLPNYANQPVPDYITKDNSTTNPITDIGATLGRVLFYDRNLSIDNTLSCSNCHQQRFAFSDTAKLSKGVGTGVTERHSMRLINTRFGDETKFFWDERAPSLEFQTTMPIKDHAELGFSGVDGHPGIDELLSKLQSIRYYNELFKAAFTDSVVTENRMRLALGQFVKSIQSFDSKYDEVQQGLSTFTESEWRGMNLFMTIPAIDESESIQIRIGGGLGCGVCHQAPEFSIAPNTGNNGVVGVANNPSLSDFDVTRAPTLRNITNPSGDLNGPLMHDGSVTSLVQLIETVGSLEPNSANAKLDQVLAPGYDLKITENEAADVIAFLKTLTGKEVYTDDRWSDPFVP